MLTSLFTFLLICIRLCVQKAAKELVKVLAFSCVMLNETLSFKNCKISGWLKLVHSLSNLRVAQKVFSTSGSYSLAELIVPFRTDLLVAPSETELLMLMRQIL